MAQHLTNRTTKATKAPSSGPHRLDVHPARSSCTQEMVSSLFYTCLWVLLTSYASPLQSIDSGEEFSLDHVGDDTCDAPGPDGLQGLELQSSAGDSQDVSSHAALDILYFFAPIGDPEIPVALHTRVCKPCM